MENALAREESEAVSSLVIAGSDILAECGGLLAVYSVKHRKGGITWFKFPALDKL
jgi:cobyrinic acid a,c-diamide synthase